MPEVTLHDLLADHETDRQGLRPPGLTASSNTPICFRQTALKLHNIPPSDPVEPVTAATVGTLIHDAVARIWQAADPDALVEVTGAHGTADVVRPNHLGVRDLKAVSGWVFDQWAADGPPDSVWTQLAIYAHDHDAGDDWTLIVDALCRDDGRCATYSRPYSRAAGEEAAGALRDLAWDLTGSSPWDAEPSGAWGAAWVCQRCPWATLCGQGTRPPEPPTDLDDPQPGAAQHVGEAVGPDDRVRDGQ